MRRSETMAITHQEITNAIVDVIVFLASSDSDSTRMATRVWTQLLLLRKMRMRSTFVNSCCCCYCFRQMIFFWKPAWHVPKTVILRCSRKQNVPHFVPSAMWHPEKELCGALILQLNCLLHSSRPRKAFCACCLRLSVDKSWRSSTCRWSKSVHTWSTA